ncbi:MAG: flagellar basal body P-ring protein FlgI [Planctomycetota bacterium]
MLINLAAATLLLAIVQSAVAVQVRDISRLKGSETNKLIGMGLVVGLNGTGDGGDFPPSARMLAAAIAQFHDPNVVAAELEDSESVALVYLSAELPAEGVAEGDRVDVTVATAGPADSLAGGTLFMVPMTGPLPGAPVMAYAEGLISIPDEEAPTVGVITAGAQMTRDVLSVPMDEYYRLRLVIDESHAGWPTANALAAQINGSIAPDGPRLAQAVDGKNVLVAVPMVQRDDPSQFISDVMTTFIDMSFVEGGAVVLVNRRTGAVVISGDVRVSPMLIQHESLTIETLDPEPIGNPLEPVVTVERFAALDPEGRGGTRLADLLAAFNQLNVPTKDLIEILESMHKAKKLHAKLIVK